MARTAKLNAKKPAQPPGKEAETTTTEQQPAVAKATPEVAPTSNMLQGLFFGLIFGFLLQKGGVAKFHVLIGQLLLADFTVLKIMLTAVVVGAIGIHFLHQAGLVKLQLKPTRLASNIVGGLLFGVGFAFAAYCPGTGAAALGQGNFDALAMMAGMVAGSYLFAEASGWISKHLDPIGDFGKLTLHELLPFNRTTIVLSFVTVLIGILFAVDRFTVR